MKRFLILASVAALTALIVAAPAFAEGYNSDQGALNPNGGPGLYTRDTGFASGPHGGYTTTTNKCQDCHSTHYAYGSFKLLRANDAASACDYCHAGGSGSTINIMMDNQYRIGSFNPYGDDGQHNDGAGEDMSPSAVSTSTMGFGTGHTLGYKGLAPADTFPAYSDPTNGLACFSCHSPHGNSARILATFANPGRALFDDGTPDSQFWVTRVGTGRFRSYPPGANEAPLPTPTVDVAPSIDGNALPIGWLTEAQADAVFQSVTTPYGKVWNLNKPLHTSTLAGVFFGFTPKEQNIVINRPGSSGIRTYPAVGFLEPKPIYPNGRWLLMANPDAEGGVSDYTTATVAGTGGVPNKYAIRWNSPTNPGDPLGPADKAYGGLQDTDNDRGVPTAPNGINMVSEFCTDCHDGTAGASTQKAVVYNSTEGTYTVAFSHDAQPRHCYRQMWMGTDSDGTDDNEGPHCRNCHNGASNCNQCHGSAVAARNFENQFYSVLPNASVGGSGYGSAYRGQPYLHTSAVAGLNGKCVDGGFSWPHRTLAYNMLKDELWGVDFDGTPVAPGEIRGTDPVDNTANNNVWAIRGNYPFAWAASNTSEVPTSPAYGAPSESGEQLNGKAAENLDSVCIDCHGDATYWNGDNTSYSRTVNGLVEWELLLKGLP